MEAAIDKSTREGYLVDYLRKIRAEARTMLLTEFDEKGYEEVIREESYEEGKAEGREEERLNTERERARAEAAEKRVKELEEMLRKKD